ncbi:unnamed protein product [Sphagnum jensenii]|uniref:Pentatricopeptide repeat-containing protein n=2 Tax=Sphagnum jensenii TaxID=128206 RepID=A0ABP1A138_9BRYO
MHFDMELAKGRKLHAHIVESSFMPDIICLLAAILNMYWKCGSQVEACKVFDLLHNVSAGLGDLEKTKDVHIYITRNDITTDIFLSSNLVDIYAKNGSMKLAYSAFL